MLLSISMLLVFLALLLGFYMAWNIGANDVANSMATAVGAKAITPRQAVLIAGFLEAAGAIFVGSHVADTVKKGIVDPAYFSADPNIFILGSIASILAASLWVTLATWKEMPISTTHSIIGALVGFGLVASGPGVVAWGKLGQVVLSWIISPLMGAFLAYLIFRVIIRSIFNSENPDRAAKNASPFLLFATFFIIFLSLFLKTPLGKTLGMADNVPMSVMYATVGAFVGSAAGFFVLVRPALKTEESKNGDYKRVEAIFRRLQILTSCYVAFAHGANDVANAIGPVAGVVQALSSGVVGAKAEVPVYLLLMGGVGIAVGVFTWGYKVMKTIGFRITELTNTRGFSVDFGVATTVLMASKLGMPVSTTHTVVGAVVGVGLARGLAAIDLRVIKDIVVSWVVTVPVAAATSAGIFLLLRAAFA